MTRRAHTWAYALPVLAMLLAPLHTCRANGLGVGTDKDQKLIFTDLDIREPDLVGRLTVLNVETGKPELIAVRKINFGGDTSLPPVNVEGLPVKKPLDLAKTRKLIVIDPNYEVAVPFENENKTENEKEKTRFVVRVAWYPKELCEQAKDGEIIKPYIIHIPRNVSGSASSIKDGTGLVMFIRDIISIELPHNQPARGTVCNEEMVLNFKEFSPKGQ